MSVSRCVDKTCCCGCVIICTAVTTSILTLALVIKGAVELTLTPITIPTYYIRKNAYDKLFSDWLDGKSPTDNNLIAIFAEKRSNNKMSFCKLRKAYMICEAKTLRLDRKNRDNFVFTSFMNIFPEFMRHRIEFPCRPVPDKKTFELQMDKFLCRLRDIPDPSIEVISEYINRFKTWKLW